MSESAENGVKKRRGKRRRRNLTNPIAVRLTPELQKAVGMCSRLLGTPVSKLLRAGLENRLAVAAVAAHRMLEEEPDMPEYRRERLVRFVDAARKAALSVHGPRWKLELLEAVESEARKLFWGKGRVRTTSRPDRHFARCFDRLDPQVRGSADEPQDDDVPDPSALN